MTSLLPVLSETELLSSRPGPPPAEVTERVAEIVDDVRKRGEEGLRHWAARLDGRGAEEPLFLSRERLLEALAAFPAEDRARLERIVARIRAFAEAQRSVLRELEVKLPGGSAGHRIRPLRAAGCYAPGGEHPLPSSVLMTAVPARVAGVRRVLVATPRPAPILLAAAAVAGADGLLAAGGAHAIAALAYGAGPVDPCEIVVGPGSVWVTEAKRQLAGTVRIDGLAGPSELVVLADPGADPDRVAGELLAQAEHADDAWVALVTTDPGFAETTLEAIARRLPELTTAATIRSSLPRGGATVCPDLGTAARLLDRLAPEHLLLAGAEAEGLAGELTHYGALFVGERSSVAFGDYGAGPNHTLPTGGAARHDGGLSVLDFLTVRSWLRIEDPQVDGLAADAAWLARQEGLEGHARTVER